MTGVNSAFLIPPMICTQHWIMIVKTVNGKYSQKWLDERCVNSSEIYETPTHCIWTLVDLTLGWLWDEEVTPDTSFAFKIISFWWKFRGPENTWSPFWMVGRFSRGNFLIWHCKGGRTKFTPPPSSGTVTFPNKMWIPPKKQSFWSHCTPAHPFVLIAPGFYILSDLKDKKSQPRIEDRQV